MIKQQAKFIGSSQRSKTTLLKFSVENEHLDQLECDELEAQTGWLYFSTSEVKAQTEKIMKDRKVGISYNGRTESQRLRGVLFQVWDKGLKQFELENETFDEFYNRKMQLIIDHFNSQI